MNTDLLAAITHALAALCEPSSDAARALEAPRLLRHAHLPALQSGRLSRSVRSRRRTPHPPQGLLEEWRSIDLLFQLTDDDLSGEGILFTETHVDKAGLMNSYLFFHVVLKGDSYPRSKLAQITRQINRLFHVPVMVLFSYGGTLSIAVINRRRSKVDASKDVLGKVTLIHDIRCAAPHRGHLDILASLAIRNLVHPQRLPITNFDTLHAAWEEIFNVELLNRTFYSKIQKWFFWAAQTISVPHGGIDNPDQRNRMATIRLLTRVIFCWFAREKRLIPPELFIADTARKVLKDFDPLSLTDGTYYTAILQNLFFPTLSVPLDQREFRKGRSYKGVNEHYMNHALSDTKPPLRIPTTFAAFLKKSPSSTAASSPVSTTKTRKAGKSVLTAFLT